MLSKLRDVFEVLFSALPDLSLRRAILLIVCTGAVSAILLSARCGEIRSPPPTILFKGLPVSGTIEDIKRAGFDNCFAADAVHLRCSRHDLIVENTGPYEAAVYLRGREGEGGFDQLIIWHNRDNSAVLQIADALKRSGWKYCYTTRADGRWGDQAIYTRAGSPVKIFMDISYYSKRRIRIIPVDNLREPRCVSA